MPGCSTTVKFFAVSKLMSNAVVKISPAIPSMIKKRLKGRCKALVAFKEKMAKTRITTTVAGPRFQSILACAFPAISANPQ